MNTILTLLLFNILEAALQLAHQFAHAFLTAILIKFNQNSWNCNGVRGRNCVQLQIPASAILFWGFNSRLYSDLNKLIELFRPTFQHWDKMVNDDITITIKTGSTKCHNFNSM